MTTVLKPFKTAMHKFKAGEELPADARLAPFTLDDLIGSGLVVGPEPEPTEAAPETPAPVAEPKPVPAAAPAVTAAPAV